MPPGAASAFKTERGFDGLCGPKEHARLTTAEDELTFLLEGYQLRDSDLSERFHAVARPLLAGMAMKHGWRLPKDVIEEVVQEVFLVLLKPTTVRFEAARGTVSQY